MGHPGDDAFAPLVDDAVAQGIIVTVMNTELPETEAKHAAAGTGTPASTNREAGAALVAIEAITRGGLQSGDKAFLWGLESQPGRGERTLGIHENPGSGRDHRGKIVYQEIDDATNGDPAAGISTFTGMASANPDLKAVFLDHGNVTSTTQAYLDARGSRARMRCTWRASTSPLPTVQAGPARTATWDLVIDQQQFLQGFEAIASDLPDEELRFQRAVHQHRRRVRRRGRTSTLIAPLVEEQIR